MIFRRVCRAPPGFGPRLAARFCERADKARKVEEKLRERERVYLNETIHKTDPGFSTVGTAVRAGKYRLLLVKVALLGGLLVLVVFETMEIRAHPLSQERELALKQGVGLVDVSRSSRSCRPPSWTSSRWSSRRSCSTRGSPTSRSSKRTLPKT